MSKSKSILAISIASLMLLASASPALAESKRGERSGDDNDNNRGSMMRGSDDSRKDRGEKAKSGAVANGVVTAITGTSITISGRLLANANTGTTTLMVDATNAEVYKNGVKGNASLIAVGDNLVVKGTVNGTSIVAREIHSGVRGFDDSKKGKGMGMPAIMGNGQPIVAGAVTSVTGNTFAIKNASNVSYTVDATNAKIFSGRATSTIASITVGDNVLVQGTINGSNVTASLVHEQMKPATTTSNSNKGKNENSRKGFFGGIGSFFGKMFGF